MNPTKLQIHQVTDVNLLVVLLPDPQVQDLWLNLWITTLLGMVECYLRVQVCLTSVDCYMERSPSEYKGVGGSKLKLLSEWEKEKNVAESLTSFLVHAISNSDFFSFVLLFFFLFPSPEFWQELHTFLTSQTSVPSGAASPTLASGSASPAPSSPSLNRRPVGASEAEKLWEDFFQSQKQYLTASEAAKIRDVTGLFGLGGQ